MGAPRAPAAVRLAAIGLFLAAAGPDAFAGQTPLGRLGDPAKAGVERYKAGSLADAAVVFEALTRQNPQDAAAHFYLALTYLRLGQQRRAEQHLATFKDLERNAAIVRQTDRVLQAMRESMSADFRMFTATILEEAFEVEAARPGLPSFRNRIVIPFP